MPKVGERRSQTAFDVLGVASDASPEDINQAYAKVRAAHGTDENSIPVDIRDAYALLKRERSVGSYREVLRACADGQRIDVKPEQLRTFVVMCARWKIQTWADREFPGTHWVWERHQAEPEEVTRQREAAQRPAESRGSIEDMLQGRRRARAFRRFLMFVLLAAAGYGAYVGLPVYLHHRLVVAVESSVARAGQTLPRLNDDLAQIQRLFQGATGLDHTTVTLSTPRSPELDRALIRHESVRHAWDETLKDRPSAAALQHLRDECERLRAAAKSGAVAATDREAGEQLVLSVNRLAERLNADLVNVEHIRQMLDADRLEHALEQPARSPP